MINCVLRHKGKVLVVQRSRDVNFYPGYWNGIAGFLDDKRGLKKKIEDELKEEIGIRKKDIIKIQFGEIHHQEAPKYKKTWIVHPVLVDVKTDKVNLDWEAQNHKWIKPSEVKKLKLLPGFEVVSEKLKTKLA